MTHSATLTQDEIEERPDPEERLELLKSKGVPIKDKRLNTDDYCIGVTLHKTYVYTWEPWE